MKRIVLGIVVASFAACSQTSTHTPVGDAAATPVAVAPTLPAGRSTELVVSKGGEVLGTIRIRPGQLGELEISGAIAAKHLIDAWAEVKTRNEVRIHMHLPTDDGSRGPYGVRTWKPTDADYVGAVETYLKYEKSFDVEVIPLQTR